MTGASTRSENPLLASVNGLSAELQRTATELLREPWDVVQVEHSYSFQPYERPLRDAGQTAPIIMLSAIGGDIDRIVGLEMGAEDYLPKPCNPRELLARVRTVLRRNRRQTSEPQVPTGQRLRFAGWQVDMGVRLLTDPDNVVVTLTDGEFRLLRAFIEHPRRVLSRDQLLDYSAGSDAESYDRAIDVQVSRLRRKLERGEMGDELVRTIRNEGYMFTAEVRPA